MAYPFLALRTGGKYDDFAVGQLFHPRSDLADQSPRYLDVSQILGDLDIFLHRPAGNVNLAVQRAGMVYNLIDPVEQRAEKKN